MRRLTVTLAPTASASVIVAAVAPSTATASVTAIAIAAAAIVIATATSCYGASGSYNVRILATVKFAAAIPSTSAVVIADFPFYFPCSSSLAQDIACSPPRLVDFVFVSRLVSFPYTQRLLADPWMPSAHGRMFVF